VTAAAASSPSALKPGPLPLPTQALGLPEPLRVTHRLDQCTEGLLVLGRSRAFVAAFNALVQRSSGGSSSGEPGSREAGGWSSGGGGGADGDDVGRGAAPLRPLRKFYRAATAAPPPLGTLRHHISVERRQQGLPGFTVAHDAPVPASLPAGLVVLQAAPVQLSAAAAARWGAEWAYECVIELLTGRTHQIRTQLSAVGCPLLGDSLYQPLACPQLRQVRRCCNTHCCGADSAPVAARDGRVCILERTSPALPPACSPHSSARRMHAAPLRRRPLP
jgi:hypothetical protein